MMYTAMTQLKDGNTDKADEIIEAYLRFYRSADKAKQSEFLRATTESYWQQMLESGNPEWKPFFEKMRPLMQWYMESSAAMTSLPAFRELQTMQTSSPARQ